MSTSLLINTFINDELKIFSFDYLGNSNQDLPIWEHTKRIIYTNVSNDLKKIIDMSELDKFEVTNTIFLDFIYSFD